MSSLQADTLSIKSMMTRSNVEGENEPNTVTEDPSSHIEGETDANKQEKPENLSTQQMLTLSLLIDVHLDKEEQIKKAEEESMLLAINKLEVIKVVREEAKKLEIHPKEVITAKAGENFKKAQDAEHDPQEATH
ncbi:hypothetical protein Tco_1345297 [Tanacetum coccineum]